MKKFTLILLLSFFTLQAYTQLPPWNTKFVVYHPDGYTDTLWIGCDENATNGYDEGLDIIDTSFHYPLAIRGYSDELENDSAYGTCVNLKKDVRGFGFPAIFEFYILHDDVTGAWPPVQIGWDTLDYLYGYDDYKIANVNLESEYGYIEGIDGTFWTIFHRETEDTSDVSFSFVPIDIISESSVYECNPQNYIVKITATVYFADYFVYIEDVITSEAIRIYPNPFEKMLAIENSSEALFLVHIIDDTGKIVAMGEEMFYKKASLNLEHLNKGNYILNIYSADHTILSSFNILKQ